MIQKKRADDATVDTDWQSEAFDVLSLAIRPEVPFLIDIKNICDTKEQCGCFLRGPVSRYAPTCSNPLYSIESAKLVVLVNNGIVHSKYDTDRFPMSSRAFTRGAIIRQSGSAYDIFSVQEPQKILTNVTRDEAARVFDFIVGELGGVVGYNFVASVGVPDSSEYRSLLERTIMPSGEPICRDGGTDWCEFDIDVSDRAPSWDIHVTLDDRLVWHIAESCRFDFTGPKTARVTIGVLSSNTPPILF